MKDDTNSVNTSFSAREKDVLKQLSCGLSEKEIAHKLHVSPITVNNHTRNIREKLGVTKNTEVLVAYTAYLKGKKFDLRLMREYGIAIFLVFVNICSLTE